MRCDEHGQAHSFGDDNRDDANDANRLASPGHRRIVTVPSANICVDGRWTAIPPPFNKSSAAARRLANRLRIRVSPLSARSRGQAVHRRPSSVILRELPPDEFDASFPSRPPCCLCGSNCRQSGLGAVQPARRRAPVPDDRERAGWGDRCSGTSCHRADIRNPVGIFRRIGFGFGEWELDISMLECGRSGDELIHQSRGQPDYARGLRSVGA